MLFPYDKQKTHTQKHPKTHTNKKQNPNNYLLEFKWVTSNQVRFEVRKYT